jgi:hypothetical protein
MLCIEWNYDRAAAIKNATFCFFLIVDALEINDLGNTVILVCVE